MTPEDVRGLCPFIDSMENVDDYCVTLGREHDPKKCKLCRKLTTAYSRGVSDERERCIRLVEMSAAPSGVAAAIRSQEGAGK